MGKREASKAETREALIQAGIALFSEQGLDVPSLDAICARAGYTRGAFYVHFKNRDDFLVAVMERILHAFLDTVQATGAGTDLERSIRRFVALYKALESEVPPVGEEVDPEAVPLALLGVKRLYLVLEACQRSEEVRERFVMLLVGGMGRVEAAVRAGRDAGVVRRDIDPEQAAKLLVTLVLGLLTVAQAGVPFDIDAAGDAVLTIIQPQ